MKTHTTNQPAQKTYDPTYPFTGTILVDYEGEE